MTAIHAPSSSADSAVYMSHRHDLPIGHDRSNWRWTNGHCQSRLSKQGYRRKCVENFAHDNLPFRLRAVVTGDVSRIIGV
jgi:hypothetical protein